jgi:Leucine-rich repeat (LRR) protein
MKKYLLPILLIAFWGCEEEEKIIVEDCAEVPGGDNICGCTNSAATNYNSSATYDDGSCCVELWGECYSIDTTILGLYNFGLSGSIPTEIGDFTNLEKLVLYGNQLSGGIPPEIGNLTNLELLNLSDNQFTGLIPPTIGSLTNLTRLVLHHNQLSGQIPSEISNLTNLLTLEFHNNQLFGQIPSWIDTLTSLTHVTFGYNQFSGQIPESICNLNLNFDNILTASHNQLCPPYPECPGLDWWGAQDTTNCD